MRTWTGALHHGFLEGIARLDADALHQRIVPLAHALRLVEVRLGGNPLHVHPALRDADTGDGPFIAWANRVRNDPGLAALIEVVLRRAGGPWVTNLAGPRWMGEVTPTLGQMEPWLAEVIRCLLGHGRTCADVRCGVVAFHEGDRDCQSFTIPEAETCVAYWTRLQELEDDLCRDGPERTTLQILEDAARQVGSQVVILDSARRSATRWTLDCSASDLHRAILGLPVYARALQTDKDDHRRLSREEAADVYHAETTIPMSRERGNLGPSRRRDRTFVAGHHGPQFFDMHAKPGTLTRVHIHVAEEIDSDGSPISRIYVGHCGKHLS